MARVIIIGNNGHYPPPVTNTAKQPCRDFTSARIGQLNAG
jgi:hypothetical protein